MGLPMFASMTEKRPTSHRTDGLPNSSYSWIDAKRKPWQGSVMDLAGTSEMKAAPSD